MNMVFLFQNVLAPCAKLPISLDKAVKQLTEKNCEVEVYVYNTLGRDMVACMQSALPYE